MIKGENAHYARSLATNPIKLNETVGVAIMVLPSLELTMEIYEKMWQEASAAFQRGEVQVDLHLLDKSGDSRRGVTLVLRPSEVVRGRVVEYLEELKAVCPGQYFYQPEELHVTVISVVSMTERWREEFKPLDEYRRLIAGALTVQRKFQIRFRGITASPSTVAIQGFPEGDSLGRIREELRSAFRRADFEGGLDRRYKIVAAHMSALRFSQPEIDWERLLPLLSAGRNIDFGVSEVECLQLIQGDWYASAGTVQVLDEYPLTL